MKVILSGEIKEVKNGYARNFLLPRKLAKIATSKNLQIFNQQKIEAEKQEKELIEKLKETAARLKDINLDFLLKIGDDGQFFGSVSVSEIKKALEDLDYQNLEIILERPIKELGEYPIEINLGKGIKTKIKITVHSQP